MARASLLTSGLEGLAAKSPEIARLHRELLALDDVLQDAHQAAKRDDENGERVVAAYEAFLRHRERLVAQLEKERVAVPWQLRMRIDDIELTLRQRKEKREAAATDKQKQEKKDIAEKADGKTPEAPSTAEEDKEKEDPLVLLKAMILPSAFVAVIAGVIYGATSFAT